MAAQTRFDMLGDDRDRFRGVSGALLEPSLDGELQAIAEEAARRVAAPIALVVLVLRRQQIYRGHVGLPPDVELVHATDRCVSLCQKVVHEKHVVAIADVRLAEVPQLVADKYGVRAYLGAPVRLAGRVFGTLCCIDVVPREFSDAERAVMVELAERVSARLERLSEPAGAPQKLLDLALGDAFAGVRAIAERLSSNVALARVSAMELDAAMRMLEQEMTRNPDRYAAWIDVPRAHVDLQETLRDLEAEARQLRAVAAGLEKATVSQAGGRVGEAIQAGIKLAAPAMAAVGGARVEGALPQLLLDVPRPLVVTSLAALLGAIAGRLPASDAGLTLTATSAGTRVLVVISGEALTEAAARAAVEELTALVEELPIEVRADGAGLVVAVPVKSQRPTLM